MNFIKKIFDFFSHRQNPVKFAKKIGVNIGRNCSITSPQIWGTKPWLITIGDNTTISFDCAFITHDGATRVIKRKEKYKDVVKFGKINIGRNCFIGARSIIMPNVTIGNSCIIAAGSVVTKDIPNGEVWGGTPAKFIEKVEDYAENLLSKMPKYDVDNYKINKKQEVLKMLEQKNES